MRGAIVGLLVGTAFVLSGCQYLLGGMMGGPVILPPIGGSFDPGAFGSFDPNDPGFSLPPPEATYVTGSATVTIDGAASTYGTLEDPGALIADYGANAIWTDNAGHYLQIYGARSGNAAIDSAAQFLSIEQVADGNHWTAFNQPGCKLDVTRADKTGFTGTATCTGLRWTNAIAPVDASGNPSYIEGRAPFDLEVTFEAKS